MSHFPIKPTIAIPFNKKFAVFSGRLPLQNTNAQNISTTASFVNPSIGQEVTITHTATTGGANFRVGEDVVIGARVGLFRTPASITTTSSCLLFRNGGYTAGTNLSGRSYFVTRPFGTTLQYNTYTTATTVSSMGNVANGSSMSWTFANFNNVPNNTILAFGEHTGTYKITEVDQTSGDGLTFFKAIKTADGDIPPGATIPSGVKVSAGRSLGVIYGPSITSQFVPLDAWFGVYTRNPATSVSATTPSMGIGWNPNSASGRDPFADNFGLGASPGMLSFNSSQVGQYKPLNIPIYTDEQRLAVPAGHALMCNSRVSLGTGIVSFEINIIVRGFFTE